MLAASRRRLLPPTNLGRVAMYRGLSLAGRVLCATALRAVRPASPPADVASDEFGHGGPALNTYASSVAGGDAGLLRVAV